MGYDLCAREVGRDRPPGRRNGIRSSIGGVMVIDTERESRRGPRWTAGEEGQIRSFSRSSPSSSASRCFTPLTYACRTGQGARTCSQARLAQLCEKSPRRMSGGHKAFVSLTFSYVINVSFHYLQGSDFLHCMLRNRTKSLLHGERGVVAARVAVWSAPLGAVVLRGGAKVR